jgi:hypothetical protein
MVSFSKTEMDDDRKLGAIFTSLFNKQINSVNDSLHNHSTNDLMVY